MIANQGIFTNQCHHKLSTKKSYLYVLSNYNVWIWTAMSSAMSLLVRLPNILFSQNILNKRSFYSIQTKRDENQLWKHLKDRTAFEKQKQQIKNVYLFKCLLTLALKSHSSEESCGNQLCQSFSFEAIQKTNNFQQDKIIVNAKVACSTYSTDTVWMIASW